MIKEWLKNMGSSKRNLLTSILLLVVMGVFAVLTIFIVVDAINKKYYNDIKVEYEVQEESPNIILTFARSEGSNFSTDNTKVVLSEDNKKFRIDGTVPTIEDGVVTNLDELTSNDGREFYFFSTNSSFIDPQEDPENPNFIFSETNPRYYVSTENDPIWYDVPKSSENLTLYSVFLTPNVHNSDFANAPLLNTSPNIIISHDVVDIPYNAFSDLLPAMMGEEPNIAKIESVVIPNTTKSINSEIDMVSGIMGGAFAACTTLTNIVIPSSVEYVGGEAFMACTGLDTVKYGNGYYLPTENNEHAILVDTNLKEENVTIHKDCISIQGNTFSKYISIVLGLIPPGEGAIMEGYININLQEITIPKNVKNIGMYAFLMCMGLENVVFEDNSDLTSIGYGSFGACSSLKTVNLEDTKLEEIGAVAFASMDESMPMLIEEITLPSTLKTIGEDAFRYCSSLSKINIQIESIESYLENLQEFNPDDTTTLPITMQIIIGLGSSSKIPSISLNQNGQDVTNIEIPDNITEIPMYAFAGLNIKSVNIPSSVTSIGSSAFRGCSSLTSITIPDSVTSIGEWTFSYCSSLTSITIPEGVTSIGDSAFRNCTSLETVNFGENSQLTSIGERAFYDCSGLETVNFGNSSQLTSIGEDAFYNCSSLTSITIPDSVTSIGSSAFYNCSSLTSITIPSGVTSIENYTFEDCSSLTSITIPDSVTSIGDFTFSGCSSLTSITIPEGVTSIGYSAFSSCSSLTSITIPESVTSIEYYAFRDCDNLTIYCEVERQPSGWGSSWNYSDRPVYWAGEWKHDEVTGEPRPIG